MIRTKQKDKDKKGLKKLDVCIVGLGYIGLPTAAILALAGLKVVGVDTDLLKIKILKNKHLPDGSEPGLKTLFDAAINSNNFVVSDTIKSADNYIISVPTPITDKHEADLSYLIKSIESVSKVLKRYDLIIIESTVPPETSKLVENIVYKETKLRAGVDYYLSHCPERVLPGNLLHELVNNDRVIGGVNELSAKKAEQIYSKFCHGKIYLTDNTTAELVKLVENSYRDVNIAFANEIARISAKLKIKSSEVIDLANKHPRVNILKPGPGVGGHCISVDPWFIIKKYPNLSTVTKSARLLNHEQPRFIYEQTKKIFKGVKHPKVAIFGLAYKGNIGDFRESPSLQLIEFCKKDKIKYSVYDPYVKESDIELMSLGSAVNGANLLILMTDHSDFKFLSPKEIGQLMKTKIVFDTRAVLNKNEWIENQYMFYSI